MVFQLVKCKGGWLQWCTFAVHCSTSDFYPTGLQFLTQICSKSPKEAEGNVHSGAPPPWLEETEGNQPSVLRKPGSGILSSPINKSGKSYKLNPRRVGAAWAEKRKIELEREKRGEIVTGKFDINWLPNFGRVWQSGSRKESRKEFEMEKQELPKVESDLSIKIQPYISKRMVISATTPPPHQCAVF